MAWSACWMVPAFLSTQRNFFTSHWGKNPPWCARSFPNKSFYPPLSSFSLALEIKEKCPEVDEMEPRSFPNNPRFRHVNYFSSRDDPGLFLPNRIFHSEPDSEASCTWKWQWPSDEREVSLSLPSPIITIATRLASPSPFWEHFILMRIPFCLLSSQASLQARHGSHRSMAGRCVFLTQKRLDRDLTCVSLLISPLFWPYNGKTEEPSKSDSYPKTFSPSGPPSGGRLFRRLPLSWWSNSKLSASWLTLAKCCSRVPLSWSSCLSAFSPSSDNSSYSTNRNISPPPCDQVFWGMWNSSPTSKLGKI